MATTIITKYGSGAPTASDVVRGELAVDTENGRLYTENIAGSVVELGTNPTTLAVDTDTLVVDATNNRVGIGLTSPDTKLHLSDGGTPELRLESTDTSVVSGQSLGDITWESNDVSGGGQGVRAKIHAEAENAGTIYGLAFSTGTGAAPTEKVRITNTGNVGIGTDSPNALTHIYGGASGRTWTPDSADKLALEHSSSVVFDIRTPASEQGLILFSDADARARGILGYAHSSDFMYFNTAGAEAMRIDSSGNVGIGITPQSFAKLQVKTATDRNVSIFDNAAGATICGITDAGASTSLRLAGSNLIFTGDGGGGAEAMRIDTSGNVGIGTSSPVSPLTTSIGAGSAGSLNNQIAMTHSGASNSYHIKTIRATANDEPAGLAFVENTTERMRIDSSGDVGIGNSTVASTRLAVTGSVVGANIETTSATAGHEGLIVNRQNSDGTAIAINKAGSTVGTIGADSSDLVIDGSASNHAGLRFMDSAVNPRKNGALSDGAVDLGGDIYRWKDLNASGRGFFNLYSAGINNGNIMVGEGVYVGATSGDNQIRSSSAGAGSATLYIGNAAIQVSSDQRLKTNIVDTEMNATEKLNQVRVVDFNWDDPSDTSFNNRNARGKWTGVLAQELVDVLPFAVNAPRNEEDLSIDEESDQKWLVDQAQMVPVLIKAIQELTARIAALEGAN
jgi:hypothetical protein